MKLFKSCRPDYKDGEQKRDFLYVKDAAEMTLFFAFGNGSAAGLFNLGSGEANSWLSLVSAVFAALEREPEIEFIDMPPEMRERYQYFTCADISKLRSAGYDRAVTPLGDAVRDCVRNYLASGRRLGG